MFIWPNVDMLPSDSLTQETRVPSDESMSASPKTSVSRSKKKPLTCSIAAGAGRRENVVKPLPWR